VAFLSDWHLVWLQGQFQGEARQDMLIGIYLNLRRLQMRLINGGNRQSVQSFLAETPKISLLTDLGPM
jgi:hypothetical protein